MVQLLGWLRPPLPPRPSQEARDKGGKRRRQVAAPPAGSSASGAGGEPRVQQPPKSDGCPAEGEGTPSSLEQGGSKAVAALPGAMGVAAILSSARHWGFLWKALVAHSANLAANLAARPLAPLHDRLQRQLGATSAVADACAQLQVEGLAELQDLLNCVLLSEHVYKIVDHTTEASVGFINAIKAEFPPQLVTLQAVSWAAPHVKHRYLLGESPDALYVSFMGTKLARDMATNANLFQEEVVLDAAMLSSGTASADELAGGAAGGTTARPGPAAHRGFLARARSVPILALYAEARARGKRLVLCGHSLGGAVASLCAVRLLQRLPPTLHHTVACYGFATPALGNEALAATVKEAGWEGRIRNYLSPDDPIPKLLSFRRPPAAAAAEGGVAADAAAPAAGAAAPLAVGTGQAGGADVAAAQQRLQRVAGHLADPEAAPAVAGAAAMSSSAAAAATAPGVSNIVRSGGLSRSSSPQAVAALAGAAAEPAGKPDASPATRGGGGGRLARAGVAAATSAAVAAAVLGQHVDVAAATSAAVAAAMLRQESPPPPPASAEGCEAARSGRQDWLRAASSARSAALAAAAPPVRAVVERAGSAARFVAAPLSAAAPQYVPLGRQLYITPTAVSAAKPPTERWDEPSGSAPPAAASAAAPSRAASHTWPLWAAMPAASAASAAVRATSSAASAAHAADAAGTAAGMGSTSGGGSLDDDDNVDVAAAAALGGSPLPAADGGDEGARRRRRAALFESHRMATYRRRLLAICQGAVRGRLLQRSLPALPSLPRPGDVAVSELLPPAAFPLRAVATIEEAPTAAKPASQPAAGDGASVAPPVARRSSFWGRLLARAAGQQRAEAPLELLIRVEGRGLSNVTRAWVEGVPAAAAGGAVGGRAAGAAAAAAEVTILEQPHTALPPPLERPPLPALGQVSAFASWLAATLGWVALLRQLQPAGSRDYLLARVRLPAGAVRDAQRAAQNTLLTQVTDGPLLQSLQLGPRLSLRLQTDFATRSLPLDIRAAAEVGPAPRRWPWPRWARRGGAARTAQHAQRAQQRGAAWWEWQPRGSPAAGQ